MEQDTLLHWYMRLEPQGFSIFPLEKRDTNYDRKSHYIGEMTEESAYQKAYNIWPDITRIPTAQKLRELERTVAGTD